MSRMKFTIQSGMMEDNYLLGATMEGFCSGDILLESTADLLELRDTLEDFIRVHNLDDFNR